mmetsp:Transcript_21359/g.68895  ORF Transcript_21359/g.68895 Transcript_21359/m.68895 type:complete len:249 (-) Transcript_21359:535-1281(-)
MQVQPRTKQLGLHHVANDEMDGGGESKGKQHLKARQRGVEQHHGQRKCGGDDGADVGNVVEQESEHAKEVGHLDTQQRAQHHVRQQAHRCRDEGLEPNVALDLVVDLAPQGGALVRDVLQHEEDHHQQDEGRVGHQREQRGGQAADRFGHAELLLHLAQQRGAVHVQRVPEPQAQLVDQLLGLRLVRAQVLSLKLVHRVRHQEEQQAHRHERDHQAQRHRQPAGTARRAQLVHHFGHSRVAADAACFH